MVAWCASPVATEGRARPLSKPVHCDVSDDFDGLGQIQGCLLGEALAQGVEALKVHDGARYQR